MIARNFTFLGSSFLNVRCLRRAIVSENVCRRTAGFVEFYHRFCFTHSRKPLLTPDLSVGGKVADAGTHFVCLSECYLGRESVGCSVKAHTREEGHSGEVITTVVDSHEPITLLLKYTLTATSVRFQNSIQTGFGGVSAPTTIEKFNPGLANASDQVTEQEHIAAVGIRNDLSVVEFEINTVSDGGVHLAFDLAHLRVEKWFEVWRADRVAVPSTSLRYHRQGVLGGIGGQFGDWHTYSLHRGVI